MPLPVGYVLKSTPPLLIKHGLTDGRLLLLESSQIWRLIAMTDSPQTSAPRRVQRSRAKGWRMPEGCVCVDRTTGFGNPFPVTKGTSTSCGVTKPIWQIGTWEGPAMWFKDTKPEAVKLAVDA